MIRLYVNFPLTENQDIFLTQKQSHYIQTVMRKKVEEDILLFNGTDGEWQARITEIQKKSITLHLLSQTRVQAKESDIWLLFSPLKPKRQEFLIEKATELGASCLWPIQSQRTSHLKVNTEKTTAHMIEAAEQSERLTIPLLKPLISLVDLLKTWSPERILLYGDETFDSPSLAATEINPLQSYGFLVGPEGGFTPAELTLLKAHPKAQGVTLNPHILRTETAALVGISYLQLKVKC